MAMPKMGMKPMKKMKPKKGNKFTLGLMGKK